MHAPAPAPGVADPRRSLLRRIHSLCGVLPIGVFLVLHLWTNLQAVRGRAAFLGALGGVGSLPGLAVVEVVAILTPLGFHALYGLFLATQARFDVRQSGSTRNWLFLFQRATGVAAVGFLAMHLGQFRAARLLGSARWETYYERLAVTLGSPGIFALYALGVTATVFHFSHGLWTASQTWGLATTEQARRRAAAACALLGVTLWVVGFNTLLHFFYRCGGLLPWPGRDAVCRDADLLRAMLDVGGAWRRVS